MTRKNPKTLIAVSDFTVFVGVKSVSSVGLHETNVTMPRCPGPSFFIFSLLCHLVCGIGTAPEKLTACDGSDRRTAIEYRTREQDKKTMIIVCYTVPSRR